MREITDIEELKSSIADEEIVLLLIKSKNCSVCDAVYEQLQPFLQQHEGVNGVAVSIDKVPAVSGEYLTFTAPTVILFIQGKEVMKQSRFISYEKIEEQITQYRSI